MMRWIAAAIALGCGSFLVEVIVAAHAADAPTVASRDPQTLMEFLTALPGSWELQLFYGLMISGTVGQIAHYAVKWARDEIAGNLFCYLWENKKTTALAFFTFIGIAITAIASGAFQGEYGGFVGWKMVFWMGVTNGFTIDALVNKTARAEWSPIERVAKQLSQEAKP